VSQKASLQKKDAKKIIYFAFPAGQAQEYAQKTKGQKSDNPNNNSSSNNRDNN